MALALAGPLAAGIDRASPEGHEPEASCSHDKGFAEVAGQQTECHFECYAQDRPYVSAVGPAPVLIEATCDGVHVSCQELFTDLDPLHCSAVSTDVAETGGIGIRRVTGFTVSTASACRATA